MAQTFGELFGTQIDQETVNEFAGLKVQQQQAMQEHTQYNERLQQVAQGVQERQQDLAATGQFFKLLDTNIPKPARDFLFRESSRALGVDPNAQSAKEVGKLLTQLDPDSAMAVRGMLNEEQQRAGPGAMRKLYTGILRGEVPISEVLQRVADYQQRTAIQGQEQLNSAFPRREPPPGMMRLGGPQDSESGTPNSEAPAPSGGGDASAEAPRPRPGDPALGRTPFQAFVDPGLSSILPDVPQGQTATVEQLAAAGYSGPVLSNDPATQRRVMTQLQDASSNYARVQDRISQIYAIVSNPASIGPAGTAQRWWDNAAEQLSVFGGWARDLVGDPDARRMIESMANRIAASNPDLQANANANARLRSLLAEMAFMVARQNDPSGRLSNQDYAVALQQLGSSWSSGQFTDVLRSVGDRAWSNYVSQSTNLAGRNTYRFDRLDDATQARLIQDPSTPTAFLTALAQHRTQAQVRAQQAAGGGLVPPLPGQPPNQPLPGTAPATDQPPGQPVQPNDQQPPGRPGQPPGAQRRSDRMTPEQERDAAQQALRAEQDRVRGIENERLQRERNAEGRAVDSARRADSQLQLQFDQFFRAQTWRNEDLALRERDRIQRSFERLGALIAGGRSGSVQLPRGGGGAVQDARAFQLPDKPRRTPPAVGRPRSRSSE